MKEPDKKNERIKDFLISWGLNLLIISIASMTITLFIWACNDGHVDWDVFWTVAEIIAIIGFFI